MIRRIAASRDRTDGAVLTVIGPSRGWGRLNLREVWAYRELLYFLAWRDIKVRYKQTVLGAAWAVVQPLFTMLIFSVVFGHLAGLRSDGAPYSLFAMAALVPWNFFAAGLSMSSNSLVGSASLVKKVYFPRIIIPLATVLACVVDLAIALVILFAMMACYGVVPGLNAVWVVVFTMLLLITAVAAGLWLSALNVKYRDVRYVVPFLTQFWMYATPVAYSSSLVPEPWHTVLGVNPMVGVVEGFRWALLGVNTNPGRQIALSTGAALFLVVTGAYYFRRTERTFADLV